MSTDREADRPLLDTGRVAYDQGRWAEAFEAFSRAHVEAPLAADDLDRLIWSAALVGDDDAFVAALEQLHELCVRIESWRLAARAAFWIGFRLLTAGTPAHAMGWLARAERHLEGESEKCAERGYLMLPAIFHHFGRHDDAAAEREAAAAIQIGVGTGEADLVAIGRCLLGRALVRQGRIEQGLAALDEVMLTVTGGELSPMMTGIAYCNVIDTCQQVFAVDRAREWTDALTAWCKAKPQLVNFTGTCLVHRAAIMQLGGDWNEAHEEVRSVCEGICRDKDPMVLANACYQRAELHRLRGELDEAEEAYRRANESGRDPQPGLALLRLAQGRVQEAASSLDRLLSETQPVWKRAQLLPAYFEIARATGEIEKARVVAEELTRIAEDFGTEILGAMAALARGGLAVELGEPGKAIDDLRAAFRVWNRIGAPHISARIRVELARAYRSLGDTDGAALELEAARRVFEQLGAAPDLAALAEDPTESGASHGLSPREREVLQLVATGKTNKVIARELFLSERTVDRHVSNILTKLGVSTRTAAAAFAFENELV